MLNIVLNEDNCIVAVFNCKDDMDGLKDMYCVRIAYPEISHRPLVEFYDTKKIKIIYPNPVIMYGKKYYECEFLESVELQHQIVYISESMIKGLSKRVRKKSG